MFSSMGRNVFAISAIKAFLGKGLPKEPGKSPASFGKFTVVQLMPIPTTEVIYLVYQRAANNRSAGYSTDSSFVPECFARQPRNKYP